MAPTLIEPHLTTKESTTLSLKWVPLPAQLNVDQHGVVTKVVDEDNSYPCRRCLHDGQIGEEVLLISYDPFLGDSPYRGASPIFVHRQPCTLYQDTAVPDQQRRRLLSVRAYDARHTIVDADVVEGSKLQQISEKFFVDPQIQYLHIHYAKMGCFAVRVERA
jgi:hypothetical protein